MYTIKFRNTNNENSDKDSWDVFSATRYKVESEFNENGKLDQWVEVKDELGSWDTVYIEDGVIVYFENEAGRTVQVIS